MGTPNHRERRRFRRRGADRTLEAPRRGTAHYGHPGRRSDDQVTPAAYEPLALLLDEGFAVCRGCESLIADGTLCEACATRSVGDQSASSV